MIRVFDASDSRFPRVEARDRAELARFARASELLARIFRTKPPRHLKKIADELPTDDAFVFTILAWGNGSRRSAA